ncbi:MAG: LLM class flavin-dependent oxidoreductase [Ilumatobacteraceae bacterium]|nr:LLM class flavin-dependent oxidoreductase [Ilumatobacteraceae bacterium]
MRYGVAIDLHATRATADEVSWPRVREQALAAEQLGFDLVVLPDHLAYRAGGEGDYVHADVAVGVRESVTVIAGLAASTTRIGVGHSVINAPYRTPAMLAHIAATLADMSDGRYSLGIGVGNSFDYDQVGVGADHRVARFEEAVEIVSGMLRNGSVDLEGVHWNASRAELPLGPDADRRPPVVVAAGGPRTMAIAARFGDAWNGWCPTDPTSTAAADLLGLLDQQCAEADRDPSTIGRTFDLGVDPLDLHDARGRSIEMLGRLAELGADEIRCYAAAAPSHTARQEAIAALREMIPES